MISISGLYYDRQLFLLLLPLEPSFKDVLNSWDVQPIFLPFLLCPSLPPSFLLISLDSLAQLHLLLIKMNKTVTFVKQLELEIQTFNFCVLNSQSLSVMITRKSNKNQICIIHT